MLTHLPPDLHIPIGMQLWDIAQNRAVTVQCNCSGNTSPYAQRSINNNRTMYRTMEQQQQLVASSASVGDN